MAKHIVKCLYCGKQFDASITPFVKPTERRYAHASCAKTAEENKTQEEKDKQELENYIKQLFGISSITPKIKKQIELYRKQNEYTYSGMLKTLKYFYEVKHNSIEKANGGIGIIPWVYRDAFDYWRAIWEAKERNELIDMNKYLLPGREIHISPPERQPMKHMRKLFTFLEDDTE